MGSPVHKVTELLLEAARADPRIQVEPPPRALFMAFGAHSLDFELRVFVVEFKYRSGVSSDLNARIDALFRQHGIAFPQLDMHLIQVPEAMARQSAEGGSTRHA